MRRRISGVLFVVVAVLIVAFARPIPYCESAYGVNDSGVCIYLGEPWDHGRPTGA